MTQSHVPYHRRLRTVGQSLEAQRINVFELSCDGERIVVKGEPEKETSLLAALRNWQRRRRSDGLNASLTYTGPDLEQIERQGRASRAQPNRLPDFHSLANMLRTVGWHLDLNGAELLELHKHELSLTIVARDRNGYPQYEERTIASFYNLFVSLHGRRGK